MLFLTNLAFSLGSQDILEIEYPRLENEWTLTKKRCEWRFPATVDLFGTKFHSSK